MQSGRTNREKVLLSDRLDALPTSATKKNILYVIHWYELSGAELYALYTMKVAQGLGHRCYCVSTVPSENRERQAFEEHCVEALDFASSGSGQNFHDFISHYIRANSIQVIHIHHSALMYKALSDLRRDFPHLMVIDTTHIVEYGNGGFPRLSAQYSAYIDKHNVVSRGLIYVQRALFQQMFSAELDLKKFHLTYASSLTAAEPMEAQKSGRTRNVITFYGRLVLQKQPNIFIATVEYLMERHPELNVEAYIYGDGGMQYGIESRIARSKFRNQIHFRGRCDDKRKVFENTDILLVSSLNEGLSLTSFEALLFHTLVVSSDVGSQCELLCTECLVPLSSHFIEDAALRLYEFLVNSGKYSAALAQNMRNLEGIRAWEVNAKRIEQLYSR